MKDQTLLVKLDIKLLLKDFLSTQERKQNEN